MTFLSKFYFILRFRNVKFYFTWTFFVRKWVMSKFWEFDWLVLKLLYIDVFKGVKILLDNELLAVICKDFYPKLRWSVCLVPFRNNFDYLNMDFSSLDFCYFSSITFNPFFGFNFYTYLISYLVSCFASSILSYAGVSWTVLFSDSFILLYPHFFLWWFSKIICR